MRIATWNLERPTPKTPDKNALRLERMAQVSADIWILTETHEVIDLGDEYHSAFTRPSPRKPRPGELCVAVWSRWPIRERLETHDGREAICVEIEHPIRRLIVYGSIIPYDRYRGPNGDSQRWEEHYKSIERHRNDWMTLRCAFPDHGFVAAGDFNQNRDGARWYGTDEGRSLLSQAFSDAKLICVTEEDFVKSGKLKRRHSIDHICLDSVLAQRVTSVDAWEGQLNDRIQLSDHNGVVVDIQQS